MVGAIAAAQLAALVADAGAGGADRRPWRDAARPAGRCRTPLRSPPSGCCRSCCRARSCRSTPAPASRNVWTFRRDHVDHLAEVSGLQAAVGQDDPMVLGQHDAGWVAVVAYLLTAAVVGIVLALVALPRAATCTSSPTRSARSLIGGSFRSPINRYVVHDRADADAARRWWRSRAVRAGHPWRRSRRRRSSRWSSCWRSSAGNLANAAPADRQRRRVRRQRRRSSGARRTPTRSTCSRPSSG